MRTCHSSTTVLVITLIINIEKCFISGTGGDSSYGSRELNQQALDQHLRRLQESLRLIRSPTTRARFRPWGGKRTIGTAILSSPNSPDDQVPCLAPRSFADLSFYSKCFGFRPKRDQFRPWGGKRTFETTTPLLMLDSDFITSEETPYQENNMYKGIRELANTGEEGDNFEGYFPHIPINSSILDKIVALISQKLNQIQTVKRQRFNPWKGKRNKNFYPWAATRSQRLSWTGERGRSTHPWAEGQFRMQNVLPADPFIPNEMITDANRITNNQENSIPHHAFGSGELVRSKRNVKNAQTTKDVAAVSAEKESRDIGGRSTALETPKRRSLQSPSKESSKRIGVLSDLIKEFENIRGGGGGPQRGFHPWAGKRAQRNSAEDLREAEEGPRFTSYDTKENSPSELYGISKRSYNDLASLVEDKRESFNPWAGKRSFQLGNLDNRPGSRDLVAVQLQRYDE